MQAMAEVIVFQWEGKDSHGKKVTGQASGKTPAQVRASLRQKGINPTKIKKKKSGGGGAIESKDIMVFIRQVSTMMTAGVPLVQAIEMIAQGASKPAMQDMATAVKNDIEAGATLASAFKRHPKQFDDLAISLIEAGEQSGSLETMLKNLAHYKEKAESLKGKIKKAMYYPIAVVIVAIVVSTILLVFVVPQFAKIFESLGAELPALTRFVVTLSDGLINNFFLIFLSGVGFLIGFVQLKKRSKAFRYFLNRVSLKLPIFGKINELSVISRFARTLAIMFSSGTPLVEALVSVAGATGNMLYSDAVMRMRDEVSTGSRLQVAMSNTGLFPSLVIQMVGIGEEAGSLETMLISVADSHEEEVNNMVDALSSLMEPLIIVFLGILVGTLVTAMYLPIFKLGEAI